MLATEKLLGICFGFTNKLVTSLKQMFKSKANERYCSTSLTK